jgi:hypothetical protein
MRTETKEYVYYCEELDLIYTAFMKSVLFYTVYHPNAEFIYIGEV